MKLPLALACFFASVYGSVWPYQGPIEISPRSEILAGPAYGISPADSFVPEVPVAQPATTIVSGPVTVIGPSVEASVEASAGADAGLGAIATGSALITNTALISSADAVKEVRGPVSGPVLVQGPSTGPIAILGPKEAVTTLTAASASDLTSSEEVAFGTAKDSTSSNVSVATEEGQSEASASAAASASSSVDGLANAHTSCEEDKTASTIVARTSDLPGETIITGASAASAGSVASSVATVIGPLTGPVLVKPPISVGSAHSGASAEAKFSGTVVAGPTSVAATIKGPTSEAVLVKGATSDAAVIEISTEPEIITDRQRDAVAVAKPVISLDSISDISASSYADATATVYTGESLNHVAVSTAAVQTTLLSGPSGTIRAQGASLPNAKKRLTPVSSKW